LSSKERNFKNSSSLFDFVENDTSKEKKKNVWLGERTVKASK
jgi:hypothetical protein